jgi:hypothetical protein
MRMGTAATAAALTVTPGITVPALGQKLLPAKPSVDVPLALAIV